MISQSYMPWKSIPPPKYRCKDSVHPKKPAGKPGVRKQCPFCVTSQSPMVVSNGPACNGAGGGRGDGGGGMGGGGVGLCHDACDEFALVQEWTNTNRWRHAPQ